MVRPSFLASGPRRLLLALAGGFTLAAPVAPAHAQQRPPADVQERAGRHSDRERLEQRIRARIAQIMRERLELDPAQEEALSAISREFEVRRRALGAEERGARERADSLIEGKLPEADAQEILTTIMDVRLAEAELFREEQQRLLEILSPAQVLELHDLRREIGRRIRAIRERHEREQRGPRDVDDGGVLRRLDEACSGKRGDRPGGASVIFPDASHGSAA